MGRQDFETETLIPEGGCFDAPAGFTVFSHNGCAKKDHAKPTDTAATVDQTGGYAPGQGGTIAVGPLPFDEEPVAFQQNSRHEVRKIGGDGAIVGALAADAGAQQQNYIALPEEPRVFSPTDYAAGRYEERPVTTPVTASRDPSRATPLAVDGYNHSLHEVSPTLGSNAGMSTGRNGVLDEPFALSIRGREGGAAAEVEKDGIAPVLRNSAGGGGQHNFVAAPTIPLDMSKPRNSTATGAGTPSTGIGKDGDPAFTLGVQTAVQAALTPAMRVRRLTPRECERLQGFPDDFSKVPTYTLRHRKRCPEYVADRRRRYIEKRRSLRKDDGLDGRERYEPFDPAKIPLDEVRPVRANFVPTCECKVKFNPAEECPDGPRYRALGNSMAVPVMRWIGKRLQMVDDFLNSEKEKSS